MFCFLTLLALSLPQFPSLDIGPVALPSFLRGKKQSSLPFLGQLLSLVTYLLYGKVRSGFYPAKASTGASKLTAQLRCACLEVWECAFPLFFKLFLLNLLTGIFIFHRSLLLVVPGIIAAYRYRQALYIMLDDPDKSVLQCIRESKAMMAGHKGELFVMDLSFIGWNILSSIPYVGYLVQIWAMPYINLSYALYYEALSGRDIYAADRGTEFPPPPVDY